MGRTVQAHETLGIALDVVNTAHDMGLTSRRGRLLQSYELETLRADLDVIGMRGTRMHEMLKFFYKSWADRFDSTEGWLMTGEETQLHRYLKETLDFQGSMVDFEAENVAANLLEASPKLVDAMGFGHIDAMDAHLMSKAAQDMLASLSHEDITLHASDEAPVAAACAYPFGAAAKTEAVVAPAVSAKLETRFFETPKEELTFVADQVRQALDNGMKTSDVFVVAPAGPWAKQVQKALEHVDIPFATRLDDAPLHGDLESLDESGAAQAACLIRLAACPDDGAAWRSWCGFGAHLMHSGFFDELWRFGHDHGLELVGCLDYLLNHGKSGMGIGDAEFSEVMDRYSSGREFLKILDGKSGVGLVSAASQLTAYDEATALDVRVALEKMLSHAEWESMDASGIDAAIRSQVQDRPWTLADGVKIGDALDVYGVRPKLTIFSGMVNGFTPRSWVLDITRTMPDKRDRLVNAERDKVRFALNRTTGKALATGFQAIDAGLGKRLRLKLDRISLVDGEPIAKVSPSVALEGL